MAQAVSSVIGQLGQWLSGPVFSDEFEAPAAALIACGIDLAHQMHREDFPEPSRVVLDGDGGLAFEFYEGKKFVSVNLRSGQRVETVLFSEGRLVGRFPRLEKWDFGSFC